MLRTFGFTEYKVYLSTRPEKSVGSDEQWELATQALDRGAGAQRGWRTRSTRAAARSTGRRSTSRCKDAIGRLWQCPTIQCDFTQPERFDIHYIGADGKEHRPVMIHRVVLAGIERFLGVLIEHYAGAFPVWLAPVQARVLPIAERHLEYARRGAGAAAATRASASSSMTATRRWAPRSATAR